MGAEASDNRKVVCVTSPLSFLGISIVKQLLLGGYYVRLILHNQEDVDKLREMQECGEVVNNGRIEAAMAKLNERESIRYAFHGCAAVFHTSAFIDPTGTSGYTKNMVDVELKVSKNVMEGCADTPSVKHCVFTSSLVTSIWKQQDNSSTQIIDHNCWSDEPLCEEKNLWYALGKLRAEKAAWNIARDRKVKLATICPGLITGPDFSKINSTSTIAYLKGAKEMYKEGLLATVDVESLAKAHIIMYEAMRKEVNDGRYIFYDQIIQSLADAEKLGREAGIDLSMIIKQDQDDSSSVKHQTRFKLSNLSILRLMSSADGCYQSRQN